MPGSDGIRELFLRECQKSMLVDLMGGAGGREMPRSSARFSASMTGQCN